MGWDRAVEGVVSAGTGVEAEGVRGAAAVAVTGGMGAETMGTGTGGADNEVDAVDAGVEVEGGGTDAVSWSGTGVVGGMRGWGVDAVVDEAAAVVVNGAAMGGDGTMAGDGGMGRTERDCVGCVVMMGTVEEVRVVVERGRGAAGGCTGGSTMIGGTDGATAVDWDAGGAEVEGAVGANVGGWASGDKMVGVVGVDDMDEVVVEITDEVEEDEAGQTDELVDMEGEDEDDGVTTVSKGGGAGTMRGNRGLYRGASDEDWDEAALAMRDEEGESSSGWDTNREVG
jgi:hypothetical protein